MAAQLGIMDLTVTVKTQPNFLIIIRVLRYTLVCVKMLQYFQACPPKSSLVCLFFVNQGILALTTHSVALKAWQNSAYNVSLCHIIKDFTV